MVGFLVRYSRPFPGFGLFVLRRQEKRVVVVGFGKRRDRDRLMKQLVSFGGLTGIGSILARRPRARERGRRPRRRLPHEPMTDWLTTILIFLPMAGALVVWLLPLSRQAVASLATLVVARRGRHLDRRGRAVRLLERLAPGRRSRTPGSARSTRATTSGSSASRSGSSGSPPSAAPPPASTPGGPAASGRARTSACCSS